MKKLGALCLLTLLSACHNPVEPIYNTSCSQVYLPIIVASGDTLWHKTQDVRCEWLDMKTGQGGVGNHP